MAKSKQNGVSGLWWLSLLAISALLVGIGVREILPGEIPGGSRSQERVPVCADAVNYIFGEKENSIVILAKPDCWSGWIDTGVDFSSTYHILPEPHTTVDIQFIEGNIVRDTPYNSPQWVGHTKGIFRVRGVASESAVTVSVKR